jgi:hypothetical protein
MLADTIAPPIDGAITGRPVSLLTAIAASSERPRQLAAVHAYWHLVQAIGDYRCCYERQQRLARFKAAGGETAELRTTQAIAIAQLHEAELSATTAQHELAAKLNFPETAPLPLPSDRPLSESYRTQFAEFFSMQKAPDRLRMLDQTLPLRQRAVESHAAAVLAAEEALDAAIELQASGQARLSNVLPAMDASVREQRAFLAAVCRYNDDIAEYSLAVVPTQISPARLVSTLIKQARPIAEAMPDTANVPAQFQQPMTVPAAGVPALAGSSILNRLKTENQPPDLIAPPTVVPSIPKPPPPMYQAPSAAATAPAVAPPIASAPPAAPLAPPAAPGTSAPTAPPQIREDPSPSLAPPQESTIPQTPPQADGAKPLTDGKSADRGTVRTAFKPVIADEPRDSASQLAAVLFTDNKPAVLHGQPLRLVDCLRSASPSRRLEAIIAYWNARHEAAIVQLYILRQQWLESLKPAIAAQNPPSPITMLVLRAARTAVDAQLVDSQADCLAADFELAITAEAPTDKGPPLPTSIPFAGHFPIVLAAAKPWSVRQLESKISGEETTINAHAAAVTMSDAARAAVTADFLSGRTTAEHVLAAIDVQANETVAFIDQLTEYNREIARYVAGSNVQSDSAENLSTKLKVAL